MLKRIMQALFTSREKGGREINYQAIAFASEDGDISYQQFSDDIERVRQYLQAQVPPSCTLIGLPLALGTYHHWLVQAACILLKIPTATLRASDATDTTLLFVGPAHLKYAGPKVVFDQQVLDDLRTTSISSAPPAFEALLTAIGTAENTLLHILYTSGSTGTPKAVPETTNSLMSNLQCLTEAYEWSSQDRCVVGFPPNTVTGYRIPLLCFFHQSTISVLPSKLDALSYSKIIRQSTKWFTVPSALASAIASPEFSFDPSDNRMVICGGSRIEPNLAVACGEKIANRFFASYGAIGVGLVAIARDRADKTDPRYVGRVLNNVEVEIVNSDGECLTRGETGVVRIKTPWMVSGYWQDGTIEPFEDGWFYPGDLGFFSEAGELFVEGRVDDRLNCNGTKFDAANIESALKLNHDVSDAFVTVITRAGVDCVVMLLTSTLSMPELETLCAQALPKQSIIVLKAEKIPRNYDGKIMRRHATAWCDEVVAKAAKNRTSENPIR